MTTAYERYPIITANLPKVGDVIQTHKYHREEVVGFHVDEWGSVWMHRKSLCLGRSKIAGIGGMEETRFTIPRIESYFKEMGCQFVVCPYCAEREVTYRGRTEGSYTPIPGTPKQLSLF